MATEKATPGTQRKAHIPGEASESNSPESLYFENPRLKSAPQRPTQQLEHTKTAGTLQEHGVLVDFDTPQAGAKASNPHLLWSRIRAYNQDAFSEFFGVFILILFGDGVVAQVTLSNYEKGSYQSISWGTYSSPRTLMSTY